MPALAAISTDRKQAVAPPGITVPENSSATGIHANGSSNGLAAKGAIIAAVALLDKPEPPASSAELEPSLEAKASDPQHSSPPCQPGASSEGVLQAAGGISREVQVAAGPITDSEITERTHPEALDLEPQPPSATHDTPPEEAHLSTFSAVADARSSGPSLLDLPAPPHPHSNGMVVEAAAAAAAATRAERVQPSANEGASERTTAGGSADDSGQVRWDSASSSGVW